jgi:hypothetical protein
MVSKPHFFLGLPDEATAFANIRMSLLTAASNFLVDTCFKSFFLPFSIGGVL